MTAYQFNYVLQGIKIQRPISKSLLHLNISSWEFYKSLTLLQRRILDEYKLLYIVHGSRSVYHHLKNHGIYFETLETDLFDGQQNANNQYIELLGQRSNCY